MRFAYYCQTRKYLQRTTFCRALFRLYLDHRRLGMRSLLPEEGIRTIVDRVPRSNSGLKVATTQVAYSKYLSPNCLSRPSPSYRYVGTEFVFQEACARDVVACRALSKAMIAAVASPPSAALGATAATETKPTQCTSFLGCQSTSRLRRQRRPTSAVEGTDPAMMACVCIYMHQIYPPRRSIHPIERSSSFV